MEKLTKKIFIDLDGTLADFEGSGGISNMWNKGFFQNLESYPRGLEVVKSLQSSGNDVYILSACIEGKYCKSEKIEWIQKKLPFIPKENIYLIPYGISKAMYVQEIYGKLNENFILFDDYSINLAQWAISGGTSIKCGKQYKSSRKYQQMVQWNIMV